MGIIRLLLAISVVCAHCGTFFGLKFVGGHYAVQAFYIISGFYMSLILNEKYVGANNSFKLFFSNRMLRLFPVYYCTLLATVILSVINFKLGNSGKIAMYAELISSGAMGIPEAFFMLFTNLFLVFQDWVMFLGLNTETGHFFFAKNFRHTSPMLYTLLFIPQAWTIGVEITYYLLAPAIVRRSLKVIAVIMLASIGLRGILYFNGFTFDPWTYRFFPTELFFFVAGTLSYHLYIHIKNKPTKNLEIGLTIALFLITVFYQFLGPDQFKMPVFFALVTIAIPYAFKLTKTNKIDVFIGDLSYPVYITHFLVFSVLGGRLLIFNNAFTTVVFSVIVSIILNEFVGKPIEKLRQSRVSKAA